MEYAMVDVTKKVVGKFKEPLLMILMTVGTCVVTVTTLTSLVLAGGSVYYVFHPQKPSYCSPSYTFDGRIMSFEDCGASSKWCVEIQPYRDSRAYDSLHVWELTTSQVEHYNILEALGENQTVSLYKRCDPNCRMSSSDHDQCQGWYLYRQWQQYSLSQSILLAALFWFLFLLGMILMLGCGSTCILVLVLTLVKFWYRYTLRRPR
jgi:hypothetical protein